MEIGPINIQVFVKWSQSSLLLLYFPLSLTTEVQKGHSESGRYVYYL